MRRIQSTAAVLGLASYALLATAGEVEIVHAKFRGTGNGQWNVSVTLRHEDTGWEHYADGWRVVDGSGRVLGQRTLYHPHENEQPFTRSLGGVAIDPPDAVVFVEAHDNVHGWSARRLRVDLGEASGTGFDVVP